MSRYDESGGRREDFGRYGQERGPRSSQAQDEQSNGEHRSWNDHPGDHGRGVHRYGQGGYGRAEHDQGGYGRGGGTGYDDHDQHRSPAHSAPGYSYQGWGRGDQASFGRPGAAGFGQAGPQGSYGQGGGSYAQQDFSGSARGSRWRDDQRFGEHNEPAEHDHDPLYRSWRDQQLARHDNEYSRWRGEQAARYDNEYKGWRDQRHEAFSKEFETWRTNVGAPEGQPSTGAEASQSAVADVTDGGTGHPHTADKH